VTRLTRKNEIISVKDSNPTNPPTIPAAIEEVWLVEVLEAELEADADADAGVAAWVAVRVAVCRLAVAGLDICCPSGELISVLD
jgi:hypothetical protein